MTETNQESLQGTVERVTFYSEESGFCVLRIQAKKHRDLITVVGSSTGISAGETVECWGTWLHHKKHGLQFKAERLTSIPPVSLDGITRYLSSGMIKGIGQHFAKRLINAFGEKVFDVIEDTPELLATVEGIGKKRREQIVLGWKEQKAIRQIMIFLHSHGVSTTRAVRIYKTYGDAAIEKVRENPYCLAQDIRGIGFKTADELAIRLGVPRDSIQRAQAGVSHALLELCEHGHCAAEYDALVKASVELLGASDELIKQAIALEVSAKRLVSEVVDTGEGDKVCLFTVSFHKAETNAVKRLQVLARGELPWGEVETEKAIPWVESKTGIQLSESQFRAVINVLKNKVSIITGGPGVGKTTIVNSVIKIIRAKLLKVALCAPTGRAAKRLSETTGLQAKTIHRLLQFNPSSYSFIYDDKQPLPFDVIIVDESSMMDILLFNHLLKAIPNHAAVIFVGDVDQLPSVGSGLVLADMIRSGVIHTVRLTEIFRQAASSRIIINAHRINQGYMPELEAEKVESDFYAIYRDEPEQVYETLIEVVTHRIPAKWGFNPILDIQVLTPMNRGLLGNTSLNVALQEKINGNAHPTISRFGTTFAVKDKVIQLVNNYDKEVFNGDIGFIEKIDLNESYLQILFDSKSVRYDFDELDEIRLAYAITIHKSQGSEFPVIVIPLVSQHYVLLARNLLYTAVTRGKKLVVLIGQKKAVYMAVQNNKESKRLTKLTERLIEALA